MKLSIELPEKEKVSKRRYLIYGLSIFICVIAVVIVVSLQILGNDWTNKMFGITAKETKTEEEENELKANFDTLFMNTIQGQDQEFTVSKIEEGKPLVYTDYEKKENVSGSYEVDLHIPKINIQNDVVKKYNQEIQDIFKQKAESVLVTLNRNIIYTVEYEAFIENTILSLVIRSNLKQGASAQQVVVQTYNFDLATQKEVSLAEVIPRLGLKEQDVQQKIKTDIQKEEKKAEDLRNLGYTIYKRDSNSETYKIENAKQFFIYHQNLYIIYAYGNDALTSEMDLVIL